MIEIPDLNQSLCEELFVGQMDVTEKAPDFLHGENAQVKQYREWLYKRNRKKLESLRKVEVALEKMDSFSRTKKNMHLPIREGIQEALKKLKALRDDMEDTDCYLDFFEYLLRGRMMERIQEARSKN